jgi:hypothetical protein
VSANLRLVVGSLIALGMLAVIATLVAPAPPAPALSVRSTDADGTMALRLWLEQSGYAVREVLSNPIQTDGLNVLFILDPFISYSSDEAATIREWVRRGNTLIVAGEPLFLRELLEPYNASVSYLDHYVSTLAPASPTLLLPAFERVRVDTYYGVETRRPDVLVHLATEDVPVLVSFREGQGTVWVTSALRPFTNRGLSDPGSARLVLNLLARVPRTAVIGFDEARHGFGTAPSVSGWLFGTAAGWGLLLAVGLTMVFLALRGRRFGRAVPIPEERLRREPVEYIQAMANLFRRSGHRVEMLRHYRGQLRRRLSERYSVDPHLSDVELVKTVAFREPSIDEAALRGVLRRLSDERGSEQDLVSAALDVDEWLRRLT